MQPMFELLDRGVRPARRVGEVDEPIGQSRGEMVAEGAAFALRGIASRGLS
jgi:hypothetical protein